MRITTSKYVHLAVLSCALPFAACSAEDPAPATGQFGAVPGQALPTQQPQGVQGSQPPGISTVATSPPQPTPQPTAQQPAATAMMPAGATMPPATPTTPTQPATPGGGLPTPPADQTMAGQPAAQPMTPAMDPAPAEMAPESAAAPEPEPEPAGGEGNLLQANDELWINRTTNGVGVQGGWYEYSDGDTDDLAIALVDDAVCLSGSMPATVTDDPGEEWGAGMGLILSDAGADAQDEWDGSAYGGFSFTASITSTTPVTIEMITDADPPHEATLKDGSNSISWSDVDQPDWASDTTAFDESALLKIQFKVARDDSDNDFELCISNLTVD